MRIHNLTTNQLVSRTLIAVLGLSLLPASMPGADADAANADAVNAPVTEPADVPASDPMPATSQARVNALVGIVQQRLALADLRLGTQSTQDLRAALRTAEERIDPDAPTSHWPYARLAARLLATEIALVAEEGRMGNVTRIHLTTALERVSPLWPLTVSEVPGAIPPIPAQRDGRGL